MGIRQKSERAIDQTNRSSDPSVRTPKRIPVDPAKRCPNIVRSIPRADLSPALVFGDPVMAKCRNVAFGETDEQREKERADRSSDADGPA